MKSLTIKTSLLILLVAVFSICSPAQTREKFNPDGGAFYVSSDSKVPKALKSFEGMAIITHDYKANGKVIPIKPTGEVYESGDRRLKMTKIVFDGVNISFETLSRGGVSYQFSGRILDSPEQNSDGQTIVLQGHLIKFASGKKIVEADLRFQFEEGD